MPEKLFRSENKIEKNTSSPKLKIIVIGASTGGFEAIKTIVKNLPAKLPASIFIVWHLSPDVQGFLPQVLNRTGNMTAVHAENNMPIRERHIYVAPPDRHLIIGNGEMLVTHGPKENRFRPAVDPLFRSAAYYYGSHVIGVILSGALDDGTAGLWAIKHYGGIAIVQDPNDAEAPGMPQSALREVQTDYCVAVSEMAKLLIKLVSQPVKEKTVMNDEQTEKEIAIAAEENVMGKGILEFGELTPYTCPECHGVLSRLHNDQIVRYRCHTGHAYSADALMKALTERIEESLYSAIRGMDENIMLLNHMGDHYAEANEPKLASAYFQKAKEAGRRSQDVRKAIADNEQLSKEKIELEVRNNQA